MEEGKRKFKQKQNMVKEYTIAFFNLLKKLNDKWGLEAKGGMGGEGMEGEPGGGAQ